MKKLISICFLLISIVAFSKDINIGDPISIKVEGVTREEINKAFEDPSFQLEKVSENKDAFNIKFRPYFVGKKSILLGNHNINIVTKSLLTEKDKENKIYENLSDKSDTKLFNIKFPYEIVVFSFTALISLAYLIIAGIKKKREKIYSPEEIFNNKLTSLSEKDWAFDLSMAIREYIDNKLNTHYVSGFYSVINPITDEDINFLIYLDRYKFSNDDADIKNDAIQKVKQLYEKIRGENNAL